jgi:hypothetical protein
MERIPEIFTLINLHHKGIIFYVIIISINTIKTNLNTNI